MNKFINYHFGSMKCFILSCIACVLCLSGLFIIFLVNDVAGSIMELISFILIGECMSCEETKNYED